VPVLVNPHGRGRPRYVTGFQARQVMPENDTSEPTLDEEHPIAIKPREMLIWRCPASGSFIAASPHPKLIEIAAARRRCSRAARA
jgi:hypothetical protein